MEIKIYTTFNGIQVVDARKIKLKRQGKLVFYIHKTYASMYPNEYSIVEYRSGLSVVQLESRKECIRIAEERLKKYTKKIWQKIIKEGVKKYSISYPLNK